MLLPNYPMKHQLAIPSFPPSACATPGLHKEAATDAQIYLDLMGFSGQMLDLNLPHTGGAFCKYVPTQQETRIKLRTANVFDQCICAYRRSQWSGIVQIVVSRAYLFWMVAQASRR